MALKNNIYVKVGLFYFAFSCLHILLYRVMDITFGINSDPFNFTYTLLSEIKRNLLMGHLPMWFSQIYTGLPLLFVGSYDIRSIIFLPWLNVMDVMVLMASITMFISGVGSFWSLKKIFGYSNQATFIASIFWTFSGIFVGYYYDQVINPVYIWSLIAFASLIEFDKNPKWYFCILLLAVFEQLLTCRFDGIEMTTLTSVVLLFLLVFAPNPTSFINSDKGLLSGMLEWLKKRVMVVLLVGLISVLLLSPILFEQWVLVRNSFRTLITVEPLVYDFSLINFFGLVPFSDEFFKFERGLNLYGHVGIVFFLLAIVGVFAGPRRKQAVYFFVAAFLVSFLMYDVKFFGYTLFDLYRLLPGHGSLRYSQRFIPAVTLFLCVPIMGGWEVIQFRLFKATEKTKLQILTTFMAVFFLVLGVILANQVTQVGWNRASLLLDILLADFIALCLIIGYVRGKKSSSYLLCSLVA